jgi:hypothetical protein
MLNHITFFKIHLLAFFASTTKSPKLPIRSMNKILCLFISSCYLNAQSVSFFVTSSFSVYSINGWKSPPKIISAPSHYPSSVLGPYTRILLSLCSQTHPNFAFLWGCLFNFHLLACYLTLLSISQTTWPSMDTDTWLVGEGPSPCKLYANLELSAGEYWKDDKVWIPLHIGYDCVYILSIFWLLDYCINL